VTADGNQPFAEWFADLDPVSRAKVARVIIRMEQGNLANVKSVGQGVLEYKIEFRAGISGLFRARRRDIAYLADGRNEEAAAARHRRGDHLLARLQTRQARHTLKGTTKMARTKSFKELVQHQVKGDAKFAEALLREGVDAMLSGDVETGKTILRDYIKATVGFEKLGAATGAPPKSLIRMFGPRGNPQAKNLFSVIGYLQKQAGLHLHVTRG
jgi:putative addiction module killer protein